MPSYSSVRRFYPERSFRGKNIILIAVIAVLAVVVVVASFLWAASSASTPPSPSPATSPSHSKLLVMAAGVTASPKARDVAKGGWYQVIPGDTLTSISSGMYNDPRCWPGIYDDSKAIIGSNPNRITPGENLSVPHKCITKLPQQPVAPASASASASASTSQSQSSAQPQQQTAYVTASILSVSTSYASVQADARAIFGESYSCIAYIITRESEWNVYAENPSSGAYGLPQALPGSKMASAGPDWEGNPVTQLRWMKSYVDEQYGGACGAMYHEEEYGWY